MSTTTVPLIPGAGPVPVQVAGNCPAGYALLNTDTAATVTVQAGATGPVLAALEPGGQLVWRDAAVFPYAWATGATGPVVLVVTDQASDYANPAAVAAVTATKLAAQGIPSTMLDTGHGTYQVPVGTSAPPVTVGESTTLAVSVSWPQPVPTGASAVRLRFDDPALPDLTPIDFYCTNNNAIENGNNTWQVPVMAPRLTITNIPTPDNNNATAYVAVVGNNRPAVGGFRQLGAGIGTKTLFQTAAALGTAPVMRAYAGDAVFGGTVAGVDPGTGPMTRFTGPVTVSVTVGNTAGGGVLFPAWVDETARVTAPRLLVLASGAAGDQTFQWNHPAQPVYWRYDPFASNVNNYVRVTVAGSP